MMRIVGWALLWALVGLVGGYVAAIIVGALLFELFNVSQREGAAAMGLAFVIGPAVACLTAMVAGVTAAIIIRRRDRQPAEGRGAPRPPWSPPARIAVGGLLGLIGGYGAATLLIVVLFGVMRVSPEFSSYAAALTVALAPWVAACAGVVLGIWLAIRRTRPPV